MLFKTTRMGADRKGAARNFALALLLFVAAVLPPASALAQDNISVSAQRHDNYARLIVTFNDRMSLPPYEVSSDNGILVIEFEATIQGVLPDISAALSEYITIARLDPDSTGIRMGLRGPMQINTIDAGEELYIDLLPPNWVGLPPSLPPETIARLAQRAEEAARLAEERRRAELVAEYNPSANIRVGRHPTFVRVIFDWNVGTKALFERDGDSAEIAFDWPVPIDLYAILSDMPEQILEVSNAVDSGHSRVTLSVAEASNVRFYEDTSTRFILDIDFAGAVAQGIDPATLLEGTVVADMVTASESESDAPVQGQDAASLAPQESLVPYINTVGSTVRVVFPFEQETPSAVFKRGDSVWMVFDTQTRIMSPGADVTGTFDTLVAAFEVQSAGGAQVVRMDLNQDRLATIGSEGRAWVLSLGDVLLSATDPLVFERRQNSAGLQEVYTDLVRPARVHQLRDPNVGDILEVVTAYPPARGIVRDLDYVDFSAPRTVHGLVIRPQHDDVSVRIEDRLAVIGSDVGLTLSPAHELRYRVPVEGRSSTMDLAIHVASNPADFHERREEIIRRAAEAEGRDLDRARLELARFYLGNNLAHESLGVLNVLQSSLRQVDLEPSILITRAAASALAHRPHDALEILTDDLLRDEADAHIWRTIARAEQADWEGARLDALGAEHVVHNYPAWVQTRFLLSGIRAAVHNQDPTLATRLLAQVDLSIMNRDQISEFELLSGMLDHMNGRNTEALESFGRVILADRRGTTSEAVLRTVQVLDEMGRLDVARGLETLTVQSAVWRGDAVELEIVEQLTDLQYRNGNYRDAFTMTRQAATTYENSAMLNRLVERARSEFAGLYLDGRADSLDTVDALSIYYDFRQLTPAGAQGDLMIRNLAHKLIRVDLLAQAAELLEYQVENRLQGAARAQVAADLAIVHIANRNPTRALQVLYQSRIAGLPSSLERQRRVLEARALIDANRNDLAIDLLSSLSGRDVDLLRIDAYWRGQRYREAGELIEVLYAGDLERGTLSPVARMNLVRAGVGYVLAKDQIGLSRLRSRYSSVMVTSPEWPMFSFVAETVESTGREFREIARQIAAVDSLNAFLNAYREIYTSENAITPLRAASPDGPV